MALIPSGYLNAVVSLGFSDTSFEHVGTGFLYAHPLRTRGERTSYRGYLVTNKHVADQTITHVRFNHPESGPTVTAVSGLATNIWTFHPHGADLAVTPLLQASTLLDGRNLTDIDLFVGDVTTTFAEGCQPVEGDGVFLIGFPFGLVGKARNYPIVRSGIVARIQDWIQRTESTFLVDAPAFPGSSGGPVVLRPDAAAIKNTTPVTHCLLAGVVSKQLRSREIAISPRTREPRIVFEEDSGLAEVVPVELVRETTTAEVDASSR